MSLSDVLTLSRPSIPEEVKRCEVWLRTQTISRWRGLHSGTMKHYLFDVRHGSMLQALLNLNWPVKQVGRYLVVR
ncbi:hypothetical protein Pla52n_50720 [Stieleria varia]|uniref:Uncharacterized protein n=1 Tax=Stieleria varia TaxID=2528005 RepID=A0A5C6AGM5_9BACT|nr:hypothetical protein Pla52n_50720 [Stieleria varia]